MRHEDDEDRSMTDTRGDGREAEAPRDGDIARSDAEKSRAQLEAENVRLRAHVAELEASGRLFVTSEGGVGGVTYQQLLTLIGNAPTRIYLKDLNHRIILVNEQFALVWKDRKPADFIGLTEADLFPPDVAADLLALEAQIVASGQACEREEELDSPIGMRWIHSNKFPIYDAEGVCTGIGAFITDITERRSLDEERLALQEQVIEAQQAALRELSTPLLPLAKGVLAMPLIGTIDSVRASEILETLLRGIGEQRVHTAILDITGVRDIDVQTADALVGAARAARLLGARVILTGVSPAVARTLVTLDANLDDIAILATLASGIAHALNR
jgi:anti-anti-sigma regulatory factor/PAS domain-containing protein